MHLKILVPFKIFADAVDVERIVAETAEGSFGILPRRLDCVACLVPSILVYESATHGLVYIAVDAGVLVKTGSDVSVSVRRAVGGADLEQLRDAVQREFLTLDEQEKNVRTAMIKMESGLLGRFADFHHER